MSKPPIDILLMQPQMKEGSDAATSNFRLHVWSSLEDLGEAAASIRGIITNGVLGVPREIIEALPRLEIISVWGVGFDRVDLALCRTRQISVTTARDVLSADVADLAMALTLSVMRRVVEADRFVRAGHWGRGQRFPLGAALTGKRMGIVGLGRIGTAIARRAAGFDMSIGYHNRRISTDSPYPYFESLHEMARWSDILMLCIPGGTETRHMIDSAVLEALGQRGYLINVARGSVLDEKALMTALREDRLAGAGLDVFADEPNVPSELVSFDNVVLQPHIAASTRETRAEMAELVYRNLDAKFQGQPLLTPLAI